MTSWSIVELVLSILNTDANHIRKIQLTLFSKNITAFWLKGQEKIAPLWLKTTMIFVC